MDKKMPIKYKSSQFNTFFCKDDTYLIYNTLYLKLYRVQKETWESLKLLKTENKYTLEEFSQETLTEFEKKHLILDSNLNEKAVMNDLIYSTIYENKLDITIVPTEACNFRCIYCYEPHDNYNMTNEVEKSVIKFFRKQIHKYKSVSIDWFGGEPLLQKSRIIRMMQTLKELCNINGVPLCSTMVTNGYLLDLNTFDSLVENKVLYYQITLDCTNEIHDKRRPYIDGSGTFDTIFNNILEIKKHAKHKYFRIIIRSNIGRNDDQAYRDFLKKILPLIGDDERFAFSCEAIRDWGGESIKNLQDEIRHLTDYETMSILPEILNKNINAFLSDFKNLSYQRCQAGKKNGFLINYDGGIYKCGMTSCGSDVNRKVGHIGYLKSNGDLYIDETKNSQFLMPREPYEHCETCSWLSNCLLSNCPLSCAKGEKLQCLKEDKGNDYIEGVIWNMYYQKNYIDLKN